MCNGSVIRVWLCHEVLATRLTIHVVKKGVKSLSIFWIAVSEVFASAEAFAKASDTLPRLALLYLTSAPLVSHLCLIRFEPVVVLVRACLWIAESTPSRLEFS